MKARTATDEVRDELVQVRPGRACDRRAEWAGLLRGAGVLHVRGGGSMALEASTEHVGVARRLLEAFRDATGARGEVRLLEPGRGHPRQRTVVTADDVSLQRLVEAGVLDDNGRPTDRVARRIVAKRCCAAAFLRGAFLARGSVGAPMAPAHLEIRAESEGSAEDLAALLGRVGASAQVRSHRGYSAYLKSVPSIGTALAAMGAHDAYLRWESGSVLKSVHVEAARLANADAANARRLARAAAEQLAAIEELEESMGLARLPKALREIAELRSANPDASIEELARMCTPPVSKGAAADRLRRLVRMARD